MKTEDIVFEAGKDLDKLISGYWYIREGYERALECKNPDCHHADKSKEDLQAGYDRIAAQICHKIVNLIMEVA